jgi:NADPH:quinone reductase-like Zn-dependent oxidoreductase
MRQIVTTGTGDIDVLKVQEKPDPSPGPDEVVIRVRAAGLNFADILARQGLYPDSPPKPCVMGYEVSGVVEAAGRDVNSSFAGKSVVAMTRFGGQSEIVAVKATQMFEKPDQ